MAERCELCDGLPGEDCSCSGAPGDSDDSEGHGGNAARTVAQQLVRAWLSVGTGGLVMFGAYLALILHHFAAAGCVAALGGALIARGARVASKPRSLLLALASRGALPPARLVP